MKNIKYALMTLLAFAMAMACNDDNIDSISKVEPGADESAPTVNIVKPATGAQIRVEEPVTTIEIEFIAQDDIELQTVSVQLDGNEITEYTDFKDYRRLQTTYRYTELANGDHTLSIVATDLAGKSTTQTVTFQKTVPYQPLYEGEVFYMPFDGDLTELVSFTTGTAVGTVGYAAGKVGQAYAGATDASVSFPTDSLIKTQEVSAVFWMKVNGTPDRAGILTVSAVDPAPTVPGTQNLRTKGFRFFRELDGTNQRFKLNVGTGEAEAWNDGGTVDPAAGEWVHMAFTVSGTTTMIYLNGVIAPKPQPVMANPIDWTGCDLLTIMSGAPRFTEWEHFSDLSMMDELRIFNKALTVEEINTMMNAEN